MFQEKVFEPAKQKKHDGELFIYFCLSQNKPICNTLGIDAKNQRNKIQEDKILSSVATLRVSTGADGKQYEMFYLPLQYIFGWIFTNNPKNVNEDAREAVTKYC